MASPRRSSTSVCSSLRSRSVLVAPPPLSAFSLHLSANAVRGAGVVAFTASSACPRWALLATPSARGPSTAALVPSTPECTGDAATRPP